jgi:uncharacterized membrane protein
MRHPAASGISGIVEQVVDLPGPFRPRYRIVLFAALFLGERLTWGKGIGGLLIVAGAITIALE